MKKVKLNMNTIQRQGFNDYELGYLSHQNPYVRGSDNFRFWNEGYKMAGLANW